MAMFKRQETLLDCRKRISRFPARAAAGTEQRPKGQGLRRRTGEADWPVFRRKMRKLIGCLILFLDDFDLLNMEHGEISHAVPLGKLLEYQRISGILKTVEFQGTNPAWGLKEA